MIPTYTCTECGTWVGSNEPIIECPTCASSGLEVLPVAEGFPDRPDPSATAEPRLLTATPDDPLVLLSMLASKQGFELVRKAD